ncbi:MAG TPA: LytTR family DNA-binding domain-containing protein [Saprospiraceae bacterium]|nr:LytTR family DNA-binding domain-containing protein [Saprospiraceae bacterium]HPI05200.1 LytTR family DNA-binding domain-containing protein [Saprospiraceae bacterium]
MKTLIVDDNALVRVALRHMVDEVRALTFVGECSDASEAFNFLQDQAVDLVLLDVEMPGMSGLDLIRTLQNPPLFILVTTEPAYAVEGFDLRVADYLVKPVLLPRFLTAVQRASELFEVKKLAVQPELEHPGGPDFLFARVNNQLVRIDFSNILYVQALGDYVSLITLVKKYTVHMTLKSLEERLPPARFARVHRSSIVAIDKVASLEENSIVMTNKDVIPLSESFRSGFLKKMNIL